MPTSITPEPGENEFECARCGAYFHYELTCRPNCGVNLYEPEDETDEAESPRGRGVFSKLKDAFHKVFNKPYSADEIFGDALDASILYNDLLQKLGGDRAALDRSDRVRTGTRAQVHAAGVDPERKSTLGTG